MNKKERFCDVDNIVEWRHIITALLVLVAMTGWAQKQVVWVKPTTFMGAFNSKFEITKVELKQTETVLHIVSIHAPARRATI